jgi:DNA-binding transcriptional MerR regulator
VLARADHSDLFGIHAFKYFIEVLVGSLTRTVRLVLEVCVANPQPALRPVDLARAAGISTQQVRNYADAGILPAAPRTPAGYRRFHGGHRVALLTFRALARGCGHSVAQTIMLAVHDGDLPLALTVIDAAHAAHHEQRVRLDATAAALEAVAEQSGMPQSLMRIGEAAARLGVRTSALRIWESVGLLKPQREPGTRYRCFTPTDLRDARMISMLRHSGYPLAQIRPVLDGLRETGSSDALRAAIGQRRAALTQQATAMLEGASYLHHYLREVAAS